MAIAVAPDGVRIHYEIHESATHSTRDPVVLVQGLGLSSRFWFGIPRDIAHDPHSPRTAVVLDNRGTGRTDRPRGFVSITRMADDIMTVIDACGIERAVIVGISMGGMIAMHAAVRHPRRVSGLVLLATTPGLPHGRLPTLRALAALMYVPFVKRGRRVRMVDRLLLPEHELDRAAQFFKAWPEAFRYDPMSVPMFFTQLAGAATHSVGFHLRRVQCPTVVVTGEEDILIPPSNARAIAKRIPRSHLEILPRVAHAIPAQEPDIIQRMLVKLETMGGSVVSPRARTR